MSCLTFRHNPYVPCIAASRSYYTLDGAESDLYGTSSADTFFSAGNTDTQHCAADGCAWAAGSGVVPAAFYQPPAHQAKMRKKDQRAPCAAKKAEDKVADHYKTKVCQNFKSSGRCPYNHLCRFAHGDDDLRTYSQNVRLGLISEEAVRDYQHYLVALTRNARAAYDQSI